jgi:hypothetical protein
MVSLECFGVIILPAALWHWGVLSFSQKLVPGIFPFGVKAAGARAENLDILICYIWLRMVWLGPQICSCMNLFYKIYDVNGFTWGHCAANRKVATSILEFFYWHNSSDGTMASDWLRLWQKLVPGIFPRGKGGRCVGLTTLPPSRVDCLEICEPQTLEPSGPVKACNGIALHLPLGITDLTIRRVYFCD